MFSIKMQKKIVDKHYIELKDELNQRLNEVITEYENKRNEEMKRGKMDAYKEEIEFFQAMKSKDSDIGLAKIIKAKPEEMLKLYKKMEQYNYKQSGENVIGKDGFIKLSKKDTRSRAYFFKESVKRVFDYEKFKKKSENGSWDAYSLCKELDVRVCPYCNRQFTFTVLTKKKKKIIRPELDHYFPQSKYPVFALSVYNLIPACHVCNSNIKGQRELKLEKHFHPYIEEDKNFKFYYEIEELKCGPGTVIKLDDLENKKAKETCDFFRLPEIYAEHADVANRMLHKAIDNPITYAREIVKILQDNGYEIKVEDFIDDMLSIGGQEKEDILEKLKKDIAQQIKMEYMQELEKYK